MAVPQQELLDAVRRVEQNVAGTEEEEKILPKLDDLRSAIGELSSHYDKRLLEVKERNQRALEQLQHLATRLNRFSSRSEEKSAGSTSTSNPEVEERVATPDFRPAGLSEVQEFMGGELSELVAVASPVASPFWSPAEFPAEFPCVSEDHWQPPARPPPQARLRDLSPDDGFRTPSPEWSPRDTGSLLRPYGRARF
jgi:hypothetical protein